MKPNSGYIPVESRYPLRGLNSAVPPTQLDPSFSPRMSNMILREGEAFKRDGYYELVDQDLDGSLMAIVDFQLLDDTRKLLAITTTRQYQFNTGTSVWDDITADQEVHAITAAVEGTPDTLTFYGDHTAKFTADTLFDIENSTANDTTGISVVSVALSSGDTVLTLGNTDLVDDTADGVVVGPYHALTAVSAGSDTFTVTGDQTTIFTAGVKFFVTDTSDNDGEYTVASSTGDPTVITVDEDVTGSDFSGNVTVITEHTAIAGDYVDWVIGTDNNTHRLYATNGRDRPVVYDGADRFRHWYPKYSGFVTCRTLEVWFSLLVMGNITTTAAEPKLIGWSDITDFDDFEGGSAGLLLLPSIDGLIQRLVILGDRLIIYADNTIAALLFIGGTVVVAAEILLQGTRFVSGRGVATFGSAHIYASQENLYFFDGTRSIRGVGDTIRRLYKQDLSIENRKSLICFNDVAKRMIFVVVPTSSTTAVTYVLDYDVFDLRQFKWTKIAYNDKPFCLGWFTRRDGPTWLDFPVVAWENLTGLWVDEGEQTDFAVRAMGSGSKVHIMDGASLQDDTVDVAASYETMDFVIPGVDQSLLGRWGEIEADLVGNTVEVYYSIDGGDTWTLSTTQTLTGDYKQYSFPIDIIGRKLRIKFQSPDDFFALRWVRAWVRPSAPR